LRLQADGMLRRTRCAPGTKWRALRFVPGMVHGSDPKAREAAKVRAVDFRGKAVGIREGALSATSDEIRSMLLHVARTYDRVADGIEAAASLSAAGERSQTPEQLDDRPGGVRAEPFPFDAQMEPRDNAKTRAADYRTRAENARLRAASIEWADVRASLLEVADTYDKLADTIEDIEEKRA
jgi:hypothetical protein